MRVEFYVACFDRVLIVELKNPKDKDKAQRFTEEAYDEWLNPTYDIGDVCCEEYICECLKEKGIEFEWVDE